MYAGDQTAAKTGERSARALSPLFLLALMFCPLSLGNASVLVGSVVCGDCHAAQADAWRASHHARAMQGATAETVAAQFNASFSHAGVDTRFERAGERFLVHTVDGHGQPDTFPVRYPLAWSRSSSIWSRVRAGACRHSRSPGTPGQQQQAASAGLISFLIRGITVTRSTGAVERRTGTTCALTVM